MADFMTPEQRSAHMSKIRSKDTKPELLLRRQLHGMGYRYRLHDPKLPGKPDLVFAGRRKVIFVNGCFWHGHDCAVGSRLPKSNTQFWADKRLLNSARDLRQQDELQASGWGTLVVWECEIKTTPNLLETVRQFLEQ
jgi:DNA mismatch endonuclease (patch repair protein)